MFQKQFYGLIFMVCFWFASTATTLGQGVYEAWVARYNGPGNLLDAAAAVAIDDDGNVYVTGRSSGSGSNDDYATIKYKPNGDTLWVRRYEGTGNDYDDAVEVAVDDSGNVYVTGTSHGSGFISGFATIKYAPNGDTDWVKFYGNSLLDYAYALAVDDSGYVYVGGNTYDTLSAYNFTTIKYAPNGDSLWARHYDGGNNNFDEAYALAVDTSGNVYVTGYTYNNISFSDYTTIKYAPNGDTLWVRRYDGPDSLDDEAFDLAVDDSGNVYVTGHSQVSGFFVDADYATIKYSPNGDSLWVRRYNGPGDDVDGANALAVDTAGNVYVTGGSIASGASYDYATIKYAPNGDSLWVRRYDGMVNDYDEAFALALDPAGNVYVTGRSIASGTGPDYVTIKYAPNGDTLWLKRYNGPDSFDDEATALALDSAGNVYVTGTSFGLGSDYDYATIKYSPCSDIPGDVNSSGTITLGDIVHLLNYLFDRDNPPCIGSDPGNCWDFGLTCRGDVNNSASITLGDIVHLLNYVFDRDNPPCIGIDPGNCWTPVGSGACCLPLP
ncbi:MAG: hypothetical protein A2Z27_05755 [candidate division Zixibacteria bacterium RBG_16_50_21]|nr:MAG: hypothetical protein A2Z27_05755 [candidate division Zixibacteria bacterium RBG_16_50_21]